MTVVLAMASIAVAALAVITVRVRDPLHQVVVFTLFGVALSLLFVVLQAPDVALSEMVVGAVAYPAMILLTLSKVRDRQR